MGVISMLNTLVSTLKQTANVQPQHISVAVEKMDLTIQRTSTSSVLLFKTDYLE